MKIRSGFVSNSSSCSFVIDLEKLPKGVGDKLSKEILQKCYKVSSIGLSALIDDCDLIFDNVFYLVDYEEGNTVYFVWVRRDESGYAEDEKFMDRLDKFNSGGPLKYFRF